MGMAFLGKKLDMADSFFMMGSTHESGIAETIAIDLRFVTIFFILCLKLWAMMENDPHRDKLLSSPLKGL